MPQRIDAFTHWLPESAYRSIIDRRPAGELSGIERPEQFWQVEPRLTVMDDYGVDAQVLTFTQHDWAALNPATALPILELAHDELRRLADKYPARFLPVATLPHLTEPYLQEFERVIDELEFGGVQLFTTYDGRPLDDPAFEPFFAMAAERNIALWLHPRGQLWYDWTGEYAAEKTFLWPFETTLAISRLVFGGIFERHPNLDVVTHHAGGTIPFLANRIAAYYGKEDRTDWVDLSRSVVSYFSSCHADTMTNGNVPALDLAHDFFDDGRLVFGSDYPFGPDRGRYYVRETIQAVEDMRTDTGDVFGANVQTLLG
ncbi:MAG: amidohydrolase family protein [Salinirussus sp.]